MKKMFRVVSLLCLLSTFIAALMYPAMAQVGPMCGGQPVDVDLNIVGQTPTDGNDVILGTSQADTINAGAGDDVVCGGGGDDTIFGDEGADIIYGQGGNDTLVGSCNTFSCFQEDSKDELIGGIGDDDLKVDASNPKSVARGGPGDDTLRGAGMLFGGRDNDTIFTIQGSEAYGQIGDDELIFDDEFGFGEITMIGGDGNDTFDSYFFFGSPEDLKITMDGGRGDDVFFTGLADHVVNGGSGDDQIYLMGGNLDIVHAGAGNDIVFVEQDGDFGPQEPQENLPIIMVFGNGGNDIISCASGVECMFYGGPGDDDITGSDQNDFLSGNSGNDCIAGLGGNDQMRGHGGNDELDGGLGVDTVQGGEGNDVVLGGLQSGDIVQGNPGIDQCDSLANTSCEVEPALTQVICLSMPTPIQ